MRDLLNDLFARLLSAPEALVYAVLGALAALENIIPPVPADVVVLFGSVLAGRGTVDPWTVFLVVWSFNVSGALLVYALARRFGPGFFAGRWGRILLRPGQLVALGSFYRQYGFSVIFISRFLPMFRSVVPPFAGVTGIGFWRTAAPIAIASAIWYGTIVYVGTMFAANWEVLLSSFQATGRWLLLPAALLLLAVIRWWRRSRITEMDEERE